MLDRIGLDPDATYLGFEYWTNKALGKITGKVDLEVPGQSCRVIALRVLEDHPIILSTSRHITQGMVDVIEERWDREVRTLLGICAVVANDPYELRIAGGKGLSATVSQEDVQAGVEVSNRYEDGLTKVVITSPTTRKVKWAVLF
jgi:hypothetical protein